MRRHAETGPAALTAPAATGSTSPGEMWISRCWLPGFLISACLLSPSLALTLDDFEARTYVSPKPELAEHPMVYRLYVPKPYDPSRSYPLIVFLHGLGSKGNDNAAQMRNHASGGLYFAEPTQQAYQPAFVALPQEPGTTSQHWTGPIPRELVLGMIDELEAEFAAIDPSRVYLAGFSMGGHGTWSIIGHEPGRFAAAMPVSGRGEEGFPAAAIARSGIPIWAVHALGDTVVDPSGSRDAVEAIRQEGGGVRYTEFAQGGHVIYTHAFGDPVVHEWLTAQRLGQPPAGVPLLKIQEIIVGGKQLAASGRAVAHRGATVASVDWQRGPDQSGTAEGSETWAISEVPLEPGSNRVRITATSDTHASNRNGETTFAEMIEVTAPEPGGDTVPPTLAILEPDAPDWELSSETNSLIFQGTASDNSEPPVVSWSNSRGGAGRMDVGSTWSQEVPLETGINELTFTATDSAGNFHRRIVRVNRRDPRDSAVPVVVPPPDILLVGDDQTALLDAKVGPGTAKGTTVAWTQLSGPEGAEFATGGKPETEATFPAMGEYRMQVAADLGGNLAEAEVTVRRVPMAQPLAGDPVYALNCNASDGESYTASDGTIWSDDSEFLMIPKDGGRHTQKELVEGTEDSTIYQTGRFAYGSVHWSLPVPDGSYLVTLKFVDPSHRSGLRTGDVFINGMRVARDLDIVEVAAPNTAYDLDIPVSVHDGRIEVSLRSRKFRLLLCGIEVRRTSLAQP